MCTLHAVVVLCFGCDFVMLLLARFGESFHAYTRCIRWTVSNLLKNNPIRFSGGGGLLGILRKTQFLRYYSVREPN